MAQDLTTLYRLAVSAAGSRHDISSPTEQSREAQLCNLWYPFVRDWVLCTAPWNSCRAIARLTLAAEREFENEWQDTDPEPQFQFTYGLPTNFLYPRYLLNFEQFLLSTYSTHKALLCSVEDAILVYTKNQESIALWEHNLFFGVAFGLASFITIPLNGRVSLANANVARANSIIVEAQLQALNANHVEYESVPEWLTIRGVPSSAPINRYIYPNGPLLTIAHGGMIGSHAV